MFNVDPTSRLAYIYVLFKFLLNVADLGFCRGIYGIHNPISEFVQLCR